MHVTRENPAVRSEYREWRDATKSTATDAPFAPRHDRRAVCFTNSFSTICLVYIFPIAYTPVSFSAYFNSFHRTRPIVENQKQLFNVTHGVSCDAMALRYAICAHAAPACPEFSAWAVSNLDRLVPDTDYSSFFYRLARASLDQYDLEIGFNAPSLRVLQATILIGLYELQQAEFGRAWLTASRAGWLTQALKLHLLDSQRTTSCIDAADIADARRALWLTIDVTSFLSLGGRVLDSISIQEVSSNHHHLVWTSTLPLPLSNSLADQYAIASVPSRPIIVNPRFEDQ